MARYVCEVCGFTYDEAEGWPPDDIAPGTLFADLPEWWTCPDCGVGKDEFSRLPEPELVT